MLTCYRGYKMLDHLLVMTINYSNGYVANKLVGAFGHFTQHYLEICTIIRWTFPCVMTTTLLFCLLSGTTKETE